MPTVFPQKKGTSSTAPVVPKKQGGWALGFTKEVSAAALLQLNFLHQCSKWLSMLQLNVPQAMQHNHGPNALESACRLLSLCTPCGGCVPCTDPPSLYASHLQNELFVGRAAMLGFAFSLVGELLTGKGALAQLGYEVSLEL